MDFPEESLVDSEVTASREVHEDHNDNPIPPARRDIRRLKIRKFLSYAVIGFFLFLNGVQYVLILPTAYHYIVVRLGGNSGAYGLVLGMYSFSAFFSNLLFGWLSDGIISVRLSAAICCVFLCAGSVMYFIGLHVWFIMLSRLVSGIGTGAGTSYWADLARNVPEKEKTKVFSVIMMFRQLGVVIGPAFNLLLQRADFYIGPFLADSDSMPGLFMAFVWILMFLASVFLYTDLEELNLLREKIHGPETESRSSANSTLNTAKESIVEAPEDSDTEVEFSARAASRRVSVVPAAFDINVKPTFKEYIMALTKDDVICLQFVLFVSGFVQTALEALLPPMSLNYIGWEESQTSMWFLVSGIVTIVIFLLVSGPFSRMFHDYTMSVFGCIVEILSFPSLIVMALVMKPCCDHFLGRMYPNDPLTLPLLLIGFSINTIGLPFIASCSVALFSNAIAERYQGLAHGIRRSLSYLGYLIGPLWAGAFLPYSTDAYIYLTISFAILLAMYIGAFIMLLLSRKTLFR